MRYRNKGFVWLYDRIVLVVFLSVFMLISVFFASGPAWAAEEYNISITTSGTKSIDILPRAGNTAAISADEITVTTTCPYAYDLTLGTSTFDTNLYLNGDEENNTEGTFLAPVDGVTSLENSVNAWGYYYDGATVPTATNVFSPVPSTNQTLATLKSALATPLEETIIDQFSVYYGATVSEGMASGSYTLAKNSNDEAGTLVYYATVANRCLAPYTINYDFTEEDVTMRKFMGLFNNYTVYRDLDSSGGPEYRDVIYNRMKYFGDLDLEYNGGRLNGGGLSEEARLDEPVLLGEGLTNVHLPGYRLSGFSTEANGGGTNYTLGEEVENLADSGGTITLYPVWEDLCENKIALYDLVECRVRDFADTESFFYSYYRSNGSMLGPWNSGVFLYNESLYGEDSDASIEYPIYFYRGVLDSLYDDQLSNAPAPDAAVYGSTGEASTWPNYVVISQTCWRIFRTTGSGGTKLIYNGLYNAESNTCANSLSDTSISSLTWNGVANLSYVGYTRAQSPGNTVARLFGTNQTNSNSVDSNIKTAIESWFSSSSLDQFYDYLEPNAGYCNDRSIYNSSNVLLGDNTSISDSASSTQYRFGSYVRNIGNDTGVALPPSLGCPRNVVDLYSSGDPSVSGGNGQLSSDVPAALITADEASLAGVDRTTTTDSYKLPWYYQNFLRSGSAFWTLSPANVGNKNVRMMQVTANGKLGVYTNAVAFGIRPVISLKHDVVVSSGSGTASDPWTICGPSTICYYPNAEGVEGDMGEQTRGDTGNVISDNDSVTLLASNFSREGYGFVGWNTKSDYSGEFYGPNETITTPNDMSGGLSLYAVWVKSGGSLQNWTGCSSLTPANEATNILNQSIIALTDQRDSQTYAVARLADGNCWMIENLRLEAEDSRDGTLAQGYGMSATYGDFMGLAETETTNTFYGDSSDSSAATQSNSLYYAVPLYQQAPGGGNIGQYDYAGFRMPRYNNTNTQDRHLYPSDNYAPIYSFGNSYTWAAAIASTTYYIDNTSVDAYGKTSETAGTSICPKGWQLPYGGDTSSSFSYLDIQLGGTGVYQNTTEASDRWRSYPNNFLYSGRFSHWWGDRRGNYGYYWSSTAAYDGIYSFGLELSSEYLYPSGVEDRTSGGAIRCLLTP